MSRDGMSYVIAAGHCIRNLLQPTRSLYDFRFKSYGYLKELMVVNDPLWYLKSNN